MTYAIIDDGMDFHRKVVAAGNGAFGAWVRMLCYARRLRTDGLVTRGVARAIATPSELRRLTSAEVRLLDADGDDFRIHDFLSWNFSAEQLEAKREAKAEGRSDKAKAAARARWNRPQQSSDYGTLEHDQTSVKHAPSMRQASGEHCSEHDAHDAQAMLGDAPSPSPSPSPSPQDPPTEDRTSPAGDGSAAPTEAAPKRRREPVPDGPDPVPGSPAAAVAAAIRGDASLGPICRNTNTLAADLVAAGPGIDVPTEIRKAGAWLRANPERRKSKGNDFLVRWIGRAQDQRGGRAGQLPFSAPPGTHHAQRGLTAEQVFGEASRGPDPWEIPEAS